MTDRLAFVGDIHADHVRLLALLEVLGGRRLVFLGDYVDRGPGSREVVKVLLDIRSREPNTVFLSGNHEIGVLAFLAGRLSFLEYAWMGGLSTIRSYIGQANNNVLTEFVAAMPRPHFEFLSSCKPFFETEQFVASHAGIDPARPASRELADTVLGRHPALFHTDVRLSKLVICGHYLQAAQKPFVSNNVICLNTGCGTIEGPLTALLYPEMTFQQA